VSMSVIKKTLAELLEKLVNEAEAICRELDSVVEDIPNQLYPDAMSAKNYCHIFLKSLREFLEKVKQE